MLFLAPIVEDHGEVEALPALLHRMVPWLRPTAELRVNPPIRVKAGSFLNDNNYFTRHVSLAGAKAAQHNGSVLVLLDCDDGCPAKLGPSLRAKAMNVRPDVHHLIVLANREFETWFLAAAKSLGGKFGFRADLARPAEFETIRNAKGWLNERMANGYDPVTDQHRLARTFDLVQAQDAQSFKRFCERVSALLDA